MPHTIPFSPANNSHLIVSGDSLQSKKFFDTFLAHHSEHSPVSFKDVMVDDLGSDYLNIVTSEPASGLDGVRYIDGWSRVGVSTVSLVPSKDLNELKCKLETLGLTVGDIEGGCALIAFIDKSEGIEVSSLV